MKEKKYAVFRWRKSRTTLEVNVLSDKLFWLLTTDKIYFPPLFLNCYIFLKIARSRLAATSTAFSGYYHRLKVLTIDEKFLSILAAYSKSYLKVTQQYRNDRPSILIQIWYSNSGNSVVTKAQNNLKQ